MKIKLKVNSLINFIRYLKKWNNSKSFKNYCKRKEIKL